MPISRLFARVCHGVADERTRSSARSGTRRSGRTARRSRGCGRWQRNGAGAISSTSSWSTSTSFLQLSQYRSIRTSERNACSSSLRPHGGLGFLQATTLTGNGSVLRTILYCSRADQIRARVGRRAKQDALPDSRQKTLMNAPLGFRARSIITRGVSDEFGEVVELQAVTPQDFGELISPSSGRSSGALMSAVLAVARSADSTRAGSLSAAPPPTPWWYPTSTDRGRAPCANCALAQGGACRLANMAALHAGVRFVADRDAHGRSDSGAASLCPRGSS